ncbi:MAG: hypothetical protein LBQ51_05595 [Desulfovibrio sp.]|jgi:uncharacterized protein YicC (UPF0701 family)|nr:hypothetical protein [Desulfovibrio sp.]
MSIARSLQQSVDKLRELKKRENGDLEIFLGNILKDIECDVERVRGLENMDNLSAELLRDFQEQNRAGDAA